MERSAETRILDYAPSNRELPLLAGIFASVLCVIFGSNAVAIKISLTGLGPFTNAGFRFGIAALGISVWAKITGRSFAIKREQTPKLLVVSVLFTLQLSLLYAGLNKTSASRGTLLINLQPFFILFLAHYFIPADRITKRKVLGLLMGFTGMALVFLGKHEVTADVQTGDFLILLTSFVWACNTTYTKTIINRFEPFHLVLYPMIFSVPLFFLFGHLWDAQMIADANIKVIASLLYQGLLTASFGFVAWTGLLQRYGAVSLHSFIFIMPVTGVLLGGLILGEPITLSIVLALLLIASGILVVNLKARKYAPLFPPRGV